MEQNKMQLNEQNTMKAGTQKRHINNTLFSQNLVSTKFCDFCNFFKIVKLNTRKI